MLLENRALLLALVPAVVLRALTVLGYPPALWFWADSFSYLRVAADLAPGPFRPAGYSVFLALFEPAHSLALVTGIQHTLGLALAVAAYALLRRRGLPGWGATLAVTPLLYDEFLILLEHMIMADTLFTVLLTGAILVLLRGTPTPLTAAIGGAMLGAAALTRSIGLPVLMLAVAFVTLRRAGPRAVVSIVMAGALPLAGYATWMWAESGTFGLTRADGMFLWARTMTFADCAVIRPDPSLAVLCPNSPGTFQSPAHWLWSPTSPLKKLPRKADRNPPAARFARAAILAQPGAYLSAAVTDLAQLLRWERTTAWSAGQRTTNPYHFPSAVRPVQDPEVAEAYERGPAATGLVEPYAGWMRAYQRFGYLPFPLLALTLAAAVAMALVRRAYDALFPALVALLLIAAPPFLTGFDVRYVIPAIPLACLATGMAAACRSGGGTRLNAGSHLRLPMEEDRGARHRGRHAQTGDPGPAGAGDRPRTAAPGLLGSLPGTPGQAL